MKIIIRFYTNGDVNMGCVYEFNKCYPGKIATFRSHWQPFDKTSTKKIKLLKISMSGKNE